jgi:hypothetical protein
MKFESELEHIEQFSEEEREEIASFYEKMSKTSDTPETDAALYPMNGVDIVWPEFARKLERERDDLRDRLNEILNRPTLV